MNTLHRERDGLGRVYRGNVEEVKDQKYNDFQITTKTSFQLLSTSWPQQTPTILEPLNARAISKHLPNLLCP